MKKPHKLRPATIEGPVRHVPVQEWAQRYRDAGHHPDAAPTKENPERWDCECGGLWRILTIEQIGRKFAHLKSANKRTEEQQRRDAVRFCARSCGRLRGRWLELPRTQGACRSPSATADRRCHSLGPYKNRGPWLPSSRCWWPAVRVSGSTLTPRHRGSTAGLRSRSCRLPQPSGSSRRSADDVRFRPSLQLEGLLLYRQPASKQAPYHLCYHLLAVSTDVSGCV